MQQISNSQIEETNAFKAITCPVKKTVILQKSTRRQISFGVTMSKKKSIEEWQRIYAPAKKVLEIVTELAKA